MYYILDAENSIKFLHPTAEYCITQEIDSTDDDFDERLQWFSEDIPKPTIEQLKAVQAEADRAAAFRGLRLERFRRLKESDWMASGDRVMTDDQRAYRQALRDLPDNTEDPFNPVWPVEP